MFETRIRLSYYSLPPTTPVTSLLRRFRATPLIAESRRDMFGPENRMGRVGGIFRGGGPSVIKVKKKKYFVHIRIVLEKKLPNG